MKGKSINKGAIEMSRKEIIHYMRENHVKGDFAIEDMADDLHDRCEEEIIEYMYDNNVQGDYDIEDMAEDIAGY